MKHSWITTWSQASCSSLTQRHRQAARTGGLPPHQALRGWHPQAFTKGGAEFTGLFPNPQVRTRGFSKDPLSIGEGTGQQAGRHTGTYCLCPPSHWTITVWCRSKTYPHRNAPSIHPNIHTCCLASGRTKLIHTSPRVTFRAKHGPLVQ